MRGPAAPPYQGINRVPHRATILRADGFEALGAVDFAIKQVGKYFRKSQRKTHQIVQIRHSVTSKQFKWKT